MDEPQYNTLIDALTDVPDPRKARGKQYSWTLLLTLVSSALASGERSGHGIASWVAEHATILVVRLRPERGRLPSESTLRRALRRVDVVALEQRLAHYTSPMAIAAEPQLAVISSQGEILHGQALDETTNTKSFLNNLIWKVNKGVKGASRRFLRGKDEADRVIGNWFGFIRR